MEFPIRKTIRNSCRYVFSLFPFYLVIRIIKILLESQGFGTGAKVQFSGEIGAIKRFLPVDSLETLHVFDIGANRGEYCREISAIYPTSRIYAFEPSASTYQLLEETCGGCDRIYLYNYGLGDTSEEKLLYKESQYARIASLTQLDVTNDEYTETVRIRKLDEIVQELGINVIDLLKIDVEGHELSVMLGGEKTIASSGVKRIQFEIGGSSIDTNTTLKDIYCFLMNHGYDVYLIKPRGVEKIIQYHYAYEQYSTTNYIAVLRNMSPLLL